MGGGRQTLKPGATVAAITKEGQSCGRTDNAFAVNKLPMSDIPPPITNTWTTFGENQVIGVSAKEGPFLETNA